MKEKINTNENAVNSKPTARGYIMSIIKDPSYINRKKLRKTVIIGFIIRLLVLIFILTIGTTFSEPYYLIDDIKYEATAKMYLESSQELINIPLLRDVKDSYLQPFWPWVECIMAYIFKSIYAARFLNIFLSAITIYIIYKLTFEISKREDTALTAARLFAYLPVTILTSCFSIKDIFLTMAVMYAFYILMLFKNSNKIKIRQLILCIALLVCVYYTRGAVVELLFIFLLCSFVLKYIKKKKYITVIICSAFVIAAFMLLKDSILSSFETKIDIYGNDEIIKSGVNLVTIYELKDIYKLPFTILYANLQPMTLKFFNMSSLGWWMTIICHLNTIIYPVAVGNIAYIFFKKKDWFFWTISFVMYAAVVILSTGVSRHYLFLLPVQIINYSMAIEDNKENKKLFKYGGIILLLMVAFYYM